MLQFILYERWTPVPWRKKLSRKGGIKTFQFKIEWLENTSLRRIFEQKSEESEEASHTDIWKKSISGKENSKCKGPVYRVPGIFKDCCGWGVGNGLVQRRGEVGGWCGMQQEVMENIFCWIFRHCIYFGLYSEWGGKALEDFEEEWHIWLIFVKDQPEVNVKIKQKVIEGRNYKFRINNWGCQYPRQKVSKNIKHLPWPVLLSS